jgi:hypothetical protein
VDGKAVKAKQNPLVVSKKTDPPAAMPKKKNLPPATAPKTSRVRMLDSPPATGKPAGVSAMAQRATGSNTTDAAVPVATAPAKLPAAAAAKAAGPSTEDQLSHELVAAKKRLVSAEARVKELMEQVAEARVLLARRNNSITVLEQEKKALEASCKAEVHAAKANLMKADSRRAFEKDERKRALQQADFMEKRALRLEACGFELAAQLDHLKQERTVLLAQLRVSYDIPGMQPMQQGGQRPFSSQRSQGGQHQFAAPRLQSEQPSYSEPYTQDTRNLSDLRMQSQTGDTETYGEADRQHEGGNHQQRRRRRFAGKPQGQPQPGQPQQKQGKKAKRAQAKEAGNTDMVEGDE